MKIREGQTNLETGGDVDQVHLGNRLLDGDDFPGKKLVLQCFVTQFHASY